MIQFFPRRRVFLALSSAVSALVLAACNQPLDFDLRGNVGGFSTADAATGATTGPRPAPDNRGVISYPKYQVAVAGRGDTINDIATRLSVDADRLASYNGIRRDVPLREGEIIALPVRVAEPSVSTGAGTSPGAVDIGTLAGDAINRAPSGSSASGNVRTAALPPSQPAPAPVAPSGEAPVRHKVERGETAFTIARLYSVPVKSLAEWNGLGPDFAIREGQYLLIPVARQAPPATVATPVPRPGEGSPTPTPPSAAKPLPAAQPAPPPAPPKVDVGKQTLATSEARMAFPVQGTIIQGFSAGKNPGINIKAAPGTAVGAADDGIVGTVFVDTDNTPIVVLRHESDLLTAYVNIVDITVKKGDRIKKGDTIGKLNGDKDAYLHFEVIEGGAKRVDPLLYLQ